MLTSVSPSHCFSSKTPVEGIVAIMKESVEPVNESLGPPGGLRLVVVHSAGIVKYLGLSDCGADTLRRAREFHQIHAYQIEYSPFSMNIEKPEAGLLQTCRELRIDTIAYSPLGRGMLTGQYQSIDDFDSNAFRKLIPQFSQKNFPRNLQLVENLKAIANQKRSSSGQLSLVWLMNQGG